MIGFSISFWGYVLFELLQERKDFDICEELRLGAIGFLCRGEIKWVGAVWEWSAYDRFQWFIFNCSVFLSRGCFDWIIGREEGLWYLWRVEIVGCRVFVQGWDKRVLWEWSAYDRFQWFIFNCSVFLSRGCFDWIIGREQGLWYLWRVEIVGCRVFVQGWDKRVLWEWSAYDRFQWFISNCSVFWSSVCFVWIFVREEGLWCLEEVRLLAVGFLCRGETRGSFESGVLMIGFSDSFPIVPFLNVLSFITYWEIVMPSQISAGKNS